MWRIELNIGEWNDEGGQQSRDMTYIKPLHASIGPKETLCQIVDSIRTSSALDEDTVSVATTIHTPVSTSCVLLLPCS
jgi:hypothetical protein